jgi:hypothetical protein
MDTSRRFFPFLLLAAGACAPYVVVKHAPEPGRALRVAVMPFKDAPGAPGSGAAAYTAFNNSLLSLPGTELVERGTVDAALKKAAASGAVDDETARRVGAEVGADDVVVGDVTEYVERRALVLPPAAVAVSARMVDVKTGDVAWTASQRVGGLKRLLTWIIWPVGAVATAISPTADAQMQRVARSIADGVAKASPASGAPAPAAAEPARTEVSSDVDRPSYRRAERPDDLAVVVGIESYSDLPSAPFAERDAAAVKAHLLALGVPERNIAYLSGSKAGRSSIEKYVEEWLPRLAKDDSRVYFYFSGHGAPDVKTGGAYLVPWDGDASYLASTGYPVKRLYEKLGRLKAKEVLVAMDACFSGAGGRSVLPAGARPLVAKTETLGVGSNVVALTASSGQEITGVAEGQGHGAFTYYLLQGLNGKASDETVRGLYEYLKPRVEDAARRGNRDQTPELIGSNASLRLR